MTCRQTKEQTTGDTVAERPASGPSYRPAVDILETKDELILRADMPGVKQSEIDIQFHDGELSIHGPAAPRQAADEEYLLREYGVGYFYRDFRVSEHIDAERITAEYADGVLTVHLPKVETAKPRKIAVQTA